MRQRLKTLTRWLKVLPQYAEVLELEIRLIFIRRVLIEGRTYADSSIKYIILRGLFYQVKIVKSW